MPFCKNTSPLPKVDFTVHNILKLYVRWPSVVLTTTLPQYPCNIHRLYVLGFFWYMWGTPVIQLLYFWRVEFGSNTMSVVFKSQMPLSAEGCFQLTSQHLFINPSCSVNDLSFLNWPRNSKVEAIGRWTKWLFRKNPGLGQKTILTPQGPPPVTQLAKNAC